MYQRRHSGITVCIKEGILMLLYVSKKAFLCYCMYQRRHSDVTVCIKEGILMLLYVSKKAFWCYCMYQRRHSDVTVCIKEGILMLLYVSKKAFWCYCMYQRRHSDLYITLKELKLFNNVLTMYWFNVLALIHNVVLISCLIQDESSNITFFFYTEDVLEWLPSARLFY